MKRDTQQLYEDVKNALRSGEPAALSQVLSDAHPGDIAEVYDLLDDKDRSRLFFELPSQTAAEVVVLLDEAERDVAIEEMDRDGLVALIAEMEPDDATDVLGQLPEEKRKDVLEHVAPEQAQQIEELLTYKEDTAGGIMTKRLVALPADATVRQAIEEIRTSFPDEDLHNIYVVDGDRRLANVVPLRRLVLNEKGVRLGTIGDPDPVAVHVRDDQEEVIHVMSKYDLAAVPVIDDDGRLLGRITHDDVMDAYEQEADEDIYHMAGLAVAETEKASIARAAGLRLSWLVPCLASMAITATVMMAAQHWFEELAVYAALIIFVPMIAAIGGNCGIQISTVIVRGMATGDLAESRFHTALMREGRIALIMAPLCGVAAWLVGRFGLPVMQRLSHSAAGTIAGQAAPGADVARIAFAVGAGMTCAILIAASLGLVLPFLFRRVGVDPAIASGPVVTTVNDIISVAVFLALASVIMA